MVATDFASTHLPASEHHLQLRRAVFASTIGTAIEWYDFFLYSTVCEHLVRHRKAVSREMIRFPS
jgi:hypothetical protein